MDHAGGLTAQSSSSVPPESEEEPLEGSRSNVCAEEAVEGPLVPFDEEDVLQRLRRHRPVGRALHRPNALQVLQALVGVGSERQLTIATEAALGPGSLGGARLPMPPKPKEGPMSLLRSSSKLWRAIAWRIGRPAAPPQSSKLDSIEARESRPATDDPADGVGIAGNVSTRMLGGSSSSSS